MLKTLLILCGAVMVSATGLHAQGIRGSVGRPGAFAGRGESFASSRPSSYRGGYGHGGGGYYHGGYRGRYFYLGGIPYFYPFGFGYPYYDGFYGDGFGYGYGYGGGYPYADGAYNGRIADNGNGDANGGQPGSASLPEAVQRQLAKRGFYKGSVDGQFGPESRNALSRFQRKQGLKETGTIDEATLQALGFTDRR